MCADSSHISTDLSCTERRLKTATENKEAPSKFTVGTSHRTCASPLPPQKEQCLCWLWEAPVFHRHWEKIQKLTWQETLYRCIQCIHIQGFPPSCHNSLQSLILYFTLNQKSSACPTHKDLHLKKHYVLLRATCCIRCVFSMFSLNYLQTHLSPVPCINKGTSSLRGEMEMAHEDRLPKRWRRFLCVH